MTEEEKPIDLKLHEAMQENIQLIGKLKPLLDLVWLIRYFIWFTSIVLTLILLKFFKVL